MMIFAYKKIELKGGNQKVYIKNERIKGKEKAALFGLVLFIMLFIILFCEHVYSPMSISNIFVFIFTLYIPVYAICTHIQTCACMCVQSEHVYNGRIFFSFVIFRSCSPCHAKKLSSSWPNSIVTCTSYLPWTLWPLLTFPSSSHTFPRRPLYLAVLFLPFSLFILAFTLFFQVLFSSVLFSLSLLFLWISFCFPHSHFSLPSNSPLPYPSPSL